MPLDEPAASHGDLLSSCPVDDHLSYGVARTRVLSSDGSARSVDSHIFSRLDKLSRSPHIHTHSLQMQAAGCAPLAAHLRPGSQSGCHE